MLSLDVLNGTRRPFPALPPAAWTQPPATLTNPLYDLLGPPGYNARYISDQNPPASPTNPSGWHPVLQTYTWLHPAAVPNQPTAKFLRGSQDDPDGGTAGYFNLQARLTFASPATGAKTWWSNLQSEYR